MTIFYMVAVDGMGAPKKHHKTFADAEREAKRLCSVYRSPVRILTQVAVIVPKGKNHLKIDCVSNDRAII